MLDGHHKIEFAGEDAHQVREALGRRLPATGDVNENSEFMKNSSAEQSIAIQEVAKSIKNTNRRIQANNAEKRVLMENYEKLKTLALDLKTMMFAR